MIVFSVFLYLTFSPLFEVIEIVEENSSENDHYYYIVKSELRPEQHPRVKFNNIYIFDRRKKSKLIFKDDRSALVYTLALYLQWEGDNRLWMYKSDDQYFYFYEKEDDDWENYKWGSAYDMKSSYPFAVPKDFAEEHKKIRID